MFGTICTGQQIANAGRREEATVPLCLSADSAGQTTSHGESQAICGAKTLRFLLEPRDGPPITWLFKENIWLAVVSEVSYFPLIFTSYNDQ